MAADQASSAISDDLVSTAAPATDVSIAGLPAPVTAPSAPSAPDTDAATAATAVDRGLRRARFGTAGTFALAGALCAVWTVRVPALKDKLGVSDGQLGLIVLAFGIGGIATMSLMGRLVARYGSRALLRVTVTLSTIAVAAIGLSPNLGTAVAAGLAFGLVFGVTDVAMNTQASILEQRYGRPLMAGMHAGWSLGAVTGGLLGALGARAGLDFTQSVVIAAVVGLPVAFWLRGTYLPDTPATSRVVGRGDESPAATATAETSSAKARIRLPVGVYIAGAIAFCAFMIEGAVADWSGLYLRDALGSAEAIAALAYPLYEGAMAIGRLTGDRVTDRFGARAVLTASGVATAGGMALAVAANGTAAGLVGFFLVGVGVCLVVPVAFSVGGALGGNDTTHAGAAIARIGTMGYTGLLLGPVLIGFLADATTLRVGLGVTVALALAVAAGSRLLPRGRHLAGTAQNH